jgi:hypothetical protein
MARAREGYREVAVYLPDEKVKPLRLYAVENEIAGGVGELVCQLALERWAQLQEGGRVEVRAPSSTPATTPPAAKRGAKICEHCKKAFTPKSGSAAAKARFCSPTCKGNWWKKEKARGGR